MQEGAVRHEDRVPGVWVDCEGFPRVSVKVNAKTNQICVCYDDPHGTATTNSWVEFGWASLRAPQPKPRVVPNLFVGAYRAAILRTYLSARFLSAASSS